MEGIGDDNVVADGLHVERHVAAWQVFIHKRIFGGPVVIAGIPFGVLSGQFYRAKRVVKTSTRPLLKLAAYRKGLPLMKALVRPV